MDAHCDPTNDRSRPKSGRTARVPRRGLGRCQRIGAARVRAPDARERIQYLTEHPYALEVVTDTGFPAARSVHAADTKFLGEQLAQGFRPCGAPVGATPRRMEKVERHTGAAMRRERPGDFRILARPIRLEQGHAARLGFRDELGPREHETFVDFAGHAPVRREVHEIGTAFAFELFQSRRRERFPDSFIPARARFPGCGSVGVPRRVPSTVESDAQSSHEDWHAHGRFHAAGTRTREHPQGEREAQQPRERCRQDTGVGLAHENPQQPRDGRQQGKCHELLEHGRTQSQTIPCPNASTRKLRACKMASGEIGIS